MATAFMSGSTMIQVASGLEALPLVVSQVFTTTVMNGVWSRSPILNRDEGEQGVPQGA